MTTPQGSTPLRVAVVGTGFGAVHAAAFRADERVRLVAVYGRNRERAAQTCKQLGLHADAAVSDFDALLAPGFVDALSLALPAPAQVELAQRALAAGKHVLLEKPLSIELADAERLHTLAQKVGAVTAIDFEFPELAVFQEAKQLITSGALGALRHVVVNWQIETYANKAGLDNWKTRAAEGGGALNMFTSHVLYNLEWLFGRVVSVFAELTKSPSDPRAADTRNTLALQLENGASVSVSIAIDAFAGAGHRIEAFADSGSLCLDNPGSDYMAGFSLRHRTRAGSPAAVSHGANTAAEDGRIATVRGITTRFVSAILDRRQPMTPDIAAGLRVQRLIAAVRQSDREGRRVYIEQSDESGSP